MISRHGMASRIKIAQTGRPLGYEGTAVSCDRTGAAAAVIGDDPGPVRYELVRHHGHSGEREALGGRARAHCCIPQKLGLGSTRRVQVLAHGRNGSGCEIGGRGSWDGACPSGRIEPSLQRKPPSAKLQRVSEKGGKGRAPRAVRGRRWGPNGAGPSRAGEMAGCPVALQAGRALVAIVAAHDGGGDERRCTCGKKVCGSSAVQRLVRLRSGPGGPGRPSSSNPSLNTTATAAVTAAVHLP